MILAVIFVAIPMIKGNVSYKLFPYYTWAFVLLAVVFYSGEVRSFARFALAVPLYSGHKPNTLHFIPDSSED